MVQVSKSVQEALFVVAEALDRIEAKLDSAPQSPAPAWDDWTNPAVHRQATIDVEVDRAEMAFQMGIDDDIPYEDMSENAQRAHDAIVEAKIAQGKSAQLATDVTVDVKPVSVERHNERLHFAIETLNLNTELGTEDDWCLTYAKGGPAWLYAHRRDLVVQYSEAVKQQMVSDLEQDDPQAAHEMARDILKQPSNPPQL